MKFSGSLVKKLLLVAMAFVAVGCSSTSKKKKFAYVEKPVEQLYAAATDQLEKKRFEEAIAFFEEVERQHPYSSWARRAMLMKAFAYYQGNDYTEAITAVDQFVSLHPGNKDAPYAYYLKAMSYYEQIRDVGRDQDFTRDAVASLTDVIRRYPESEYARDSRLKLDLTHDHLAGKEMYVGRFYVKHNKYISAINRFKYVITEYQTTTQVPEALHRLVESYLAIGIQSEARSAAAMLGYNYPGSRWYQDTYALLEKNDLVEKWNLANPKVKVLPRAQKAKEVEEAVVEKSGSSVKTITDKMKKIDPNLAEERAKEIAKEPVNPGS